MTGSWCRRCGHPRAAHEHYRPGTDCALCRCDQWQSRGQAPARAADLVIIAAVLVIAIIMIMVFQAWIPT